MKLTKKGIFEIIIIAILSIFLVYYTNDKNMHNNPIVAYRVYLDGESIGLIESKEKLENYINDQQELLKKKYNVDKIYIPDEINVIKDITYTETLDSIESIYNKINNISPFAIKGYQVTVDKTNSMVYSNDEDEKDNNEPKIIKIFVLNKDIFREAVENVVTSFVDGDKYKAYIEDNQVKIETTGELIENIYIEDKITILETNISTQANIFMDVASLTKYLIFGNNDKEGTYSVKKGDTISKIADVNKMSVNELLIANNDIHSENTLLYIGQKLTTGIVNPIFTTIVEQHIVADKVNKYQTEYRYDNTKLQGYSNTIQEGSNGTIRITKKVKTLNGEIVNAYIVSSEEIVPTITKIVVKGGKQNKLGDGEWLWPTNIPYIISSNYGWRWGKLHSGVDICGTRRGSPIYAARAGTVVKISYHSSMGYYITLKHTNGYYTQYLHLQNINENDKSGSEASSFKYVQVGDFIEAGTVIGDMGSSGGSTGVHLHFEIWNGPPYEANSYNPLMFY